MDVFKYLTDISNNYEKSLAAGYKKNNGIFYTDFDLANKILEFLKIPYHCSIIDPCCGTGSFILAALQQGYRNVYGADIDKLAISLCKPFAESSRLMTMDTIGHDGRTTLKNLKVEKPFDFVVGNPPYATLSKNITIDTDDNVFLRCVRMSGNNLFVAAMYRAFELAKKTGYICYIIPKNFLHVSSYSMLRKKILQEKRIVSIIDIGAYFKNVRGEQIILTLQNTYQSNNNIRLLKLKNQNFVENLIVPQNCYKDHIILFDNINDYEIYRKLNKTSKRLRDVCEGYVGRGKSKSNQSISGKDLRKFGFKKNKVPHKGNKVFIQNIYSAESGIIASFAGNLEASQTVTVFTDGNEKICRYIVGFLHSRLCNFYMVKFLYNNSKLTMHTDAEYLKRLPLIIDTDTFSKIIELVISLEHTEYMSDDWFCSLEYLNILIYKTYKLNNDEIQYVESEIKRIQSPRWNDDKRRKKM